MKRVSRDINWQASQLDLNDQQRQSSSGDESRRNINTNTDNNDDDDDPNTPASIPTSHLDPNLHNPMAPTDHVKQNVHSRKIALLTTPLSHLEDPRTTKHTPRTIHKPRMPLITTPTRLQRRRGRGSNRRRKHREHRLLSRLIRRAHIA